MDAPNPNVLNSEKNPERWCLFLRYLAQKIAFSQTAAITKLCKNKAQIERFDQFQAQALIYSEHFKATSKAQIYLELSSLH